MPYWFVWIETLVIGVVLGFVAAFILSLIAKWEIHHRWRTFCFFCVGFWLCFGMLVALLYFRALTFDWHYIAIPLIGSIVSVHATNYARS